MATKVEFDYDLARFISFRDREVCERVRRIRRSELPDHPNPDFRISIVDAAAEFYRRFAEDLVGRIRATRDEGRTFVAILPVVPGFVRAATTPNGQVADPTFVDVLYTYAWFVTFVLSAVLYLVSAPRAAQRPS